MNSAIMDNLNIRASTENDAESVARIYNHYVEHSIVTFEEEGISADGMAERIRETASDSLPWLVAEQQGQIAGYAYASKWKGRCAYRYSVESTVYLDPAFTGRGIGTGLYTELLGILKRNSMHVVIGGISLPNPASVAMHERLGFIKVAHFKEVGFKFNRWIDVGYWQLSF
jgi:L-amino acid N-acyltransferase YncA